MDKDRLFTGSNDQTVRSYNIKVIEEEEGLGISEITSEII